MGVFLWMMSLEKCIHDLKVLSFSTRHVMSDQCVTKGRAPYKVGKTIISQSYRINIILYTVGHDIPTVGLISQLLGLLIMMLKINLKKGLSFLLDTEVFYSRYYNLGWYSQRLQSAFRSSLKVNLCYA